jgi:pilus assembly protein CpaC
MNRSLLLLVAVSLAAGLLPSHAAAPSDAPAQDGGARAELAREPDLWLMTGRTQHIVPPWPVKGVSLTDPEVADVQLPLPELVVVSGLAPGRTDVILWSEDGQTLRRSVEVLVDVERVQRDLATLFPDAGLRATQSEKVLVVRGTLENADEAEQLSAWLEGLELPYVNQVGLPGVQQVQVKVRVAEVSRTATRSLGVNGFYAGEDFFGGSTVGPSSGGPINPVSIGPPLGASVGDPTFVFNEAVNVAPGVTLFGGFPNADLEFFIQALSENQYLRLLAEPTLVALSGEEAAFLAGGEFPIPVVQGGTTGAGGVSITIEYKEYGVGLKFRPAVLGEGRIRMQVFSEVSEISDIGAVEIQGFRVPAIVARRAETTLEMSSGQTFAMAGLLSESSAGQSSQVPGLGNLPILGPLFRSVRYRQGETELVVLVTPELVAPVSDQDLPPLPGTDHMVPDEWELYAEGRLEGRTPGRLPPEMSTWLERAGLTELRGPGAWSTHEEPSAPSQAVRGAVPPGPPQAGETAEDPEE